MILQAFKCMLGQVCGLVKCFLAKDHQNIIEIRLEGSNRKRVNCHGNQFLYSRRCFPYRTNSLPSFNDLCYKLTKMALFNILLDVIVG